MPLSSRPSAFRRFARHRLGVVALFVFATFVALALLAPFIAPYDPIIGNVFIAKEGPSTAHWLGTDELGRDILSRLLFGARVSVSVGLLTVGVSVGLGVPLGALSGYAGGLVDLLTQRASDALQAFPGILLAVLVGAIIGPSLEWTVAVLGFLAVPVYTRLVRGSVLLVKQFTFVEAARSVGCGPFRIVARHVLPNAMAPVIVQSSLQFAFSVLLLAGLGFLGLGAPPPTPEWGAMLASGRTYVRSSPHMVIFPGIAISTVVLSLNLIGDAIRDAFDPRAFSRSRG